MPAATSARVANDSTFFEHRHAFLLHVSTLLPFKLLAILLVIPVFSCGSETRRNDDMGALVPELLLGRDGVWEGELVNGEYRMRNESEDPTLYYFSVDGKPGSEGRRTARVDVTLATESPTSHAGLVYGVTTEPETFFYLFALRPGPLATIYRWDSEGVNELSSVSGDDVPAGTNTLAIEEDGDRVRFFVGDREISSISGRGVGAGQIGVAAWGIGEFVFDRFDLLPALDGPGSSGDEPVVANAGTQLHLRVVEILDESGFGQPVVALRFLAPVDWRVQGGVTWNWQFSCINELVQLGIQATSPDGSLAFEIFPTWFAEWVEDDYELQVKQQAMQQGQQQCPLAPPFDAPTFLTEYFVPGFRAGANVRAAEPHPETAQALSQKVRRRFAEVGMSQYDINADAASIVISHGNADERVLASTYVMQMQGLSLSAQAQGRMAMRNQYFSIAENVYGFRAPRGELDRNEALFATILGSLQINPAWQTAITLVQGKITQNNIRQIAEMGRIWNEAARREQDIQNRDWQRSQRERDALAESWTQMMKGVASYQDPDDGTTVELTDGFDVVWAKNGSEFLLSTDPSFDPNVVLRDQSWNQLRRVSRP